MKTITAQDAHKLLPEEELEKLKSWCREQNLDPDDVHKIEILEPPLSRILGPFMRVTKIVRDPDGFPMADPRHNDMPWFQRSWHVMITSFPELRWGQELTNE